MFLVLFSFGFLSDMKLQFSGSFLHFFDDFQWTTAPSSALSAKAYNSELLILSPPKFLPKQLIVMLNKNSQKLGFNRRWSEGDFQARCTISRQQLQKQAPAPTLYRCYAWQHSLKPLEKSKFTIGCLIIIIIIIIIIIVILLFIVLIYDKLNLWINIVY